MYMYWLRIYISRSKVGNVTRCDALPGYVFSFTISKKIKGKKKVKNKSKIN